jgi:hypothetical protein
MLALHADHNGSLGVACARLPVILTDAYKSLEGISHPTEIEVVATTEVEKLFERPRDLARHLLQETVGWARVFGRVHAMRAREALEEIGEGINGARLSRVVFFARALIETAAMCAYYRQSYSADLQTLAELSRGEVKEWLSGKSSPLGLRVKEAWNHLRWLPGRARFNFAPERATDLVNQPVLAKDDPIHQVSVLTAIQKLKFSDAVLQNATAEYWYGLLSEYVHPNAGVFMLKQRSVMEVREGMLTLRYGPVELSDSAGWALLHIAVPIEESCRCIVENVRAFQDASSHASLLLHTTG